MQIKQKQSIKKQPEIEFLTKRFSLIQLTGAGLLITGMIMIGMGLSHSKDILVQISNPILWYIEFTAVAIVGIIGMLTGKKEK